MVTYGYERRRGIPPGWIILFLLFVGGVVGYMGFSSTFERVAPVIKAPTTSVWNFRTPLKVMLQDNVGVVSYKAYLQDAKGGILPLAEAILPTAQQNVALDLAYPKTSPIPTGSVKLVIEVRDGSLWRFFQGNSTTLSQDITPDVQAPVVSVLSHSYMIARGGAALVVFGAKDTNMADVHIRVGDKVMFHAAPFYKPGYYAALIAWPMSMESFSATIEAVDKAGNQSTASIPLSTKVVPYKESNIKIDDAFLGGKISSLSHTMQTTPSTTGVERFKFVNETMRQANQQKIIELTTKPLSAISDFAVVPFYPLKNGQVVAHYGDHRHFFYNEGQVSESYHMGLDLASNQAAPIVASNGGKVIYAADNGIFGTMPLIDHGLGLYTLYGHCTASSVTQGQTITAGTVIASTGTSGLALGDHLHFGIVVQGIDVRPVEWLDAHWIKLNITDIITSAKKLIDGQGQ